MFSNAEPANDSEDFARFSKLDDEQLQQLAEKYAADDLNKLIPLLVGNPAFMQAKFDRFGTDSSFLNDLDHTIRLLSNSTSNSHFLTLLQLHVVRQLCRRRLTMYYPMDLQTLIYLGETNKAINLANHLLASSAAWIEVYQTLLEQSDNRPDLLDKAEQALKHSDLQSTADATLSQIIGIRAALLTLGGDSEAGQALLSTERRANTHCANLLARLDRPDLVLPILSLLDRWQQNEVLPHLIDAYLRQGHLLQAREAVEKLEINASFSKTTWTRAYSAFAIASKKNGQFASDLLQVLLDSQPYDSHQLAAFLTCFPLEQSMAIVQKFHGQKKKHQYDESNKSIRTELALAYARIGQVDIAIGHANAIDTIYGPYWRIRAYSEIANVLAVQGNLVGARAAFNKMETLQYGMYEFHDTMFLCTKMASMLEKLGYRIQAVQLLEALRTGDFNQLGWGVAELNNLEIAKTYVALGDFKRAEQIVKPSSEGFANILTAEAFSLANQSRFEEAQAAMERAIQVTETWSGLPNQWVEELLAHNFIKYAHKLLPVAYRYIENTFGGEDKPEHGLEEIPRTIKNNLILGDKEGALRIVDVHINAYGLRYGSRHLAEAAGFFAQHSEFEVAQSLISHLQDDSAVDFGYRKIVEAYSQFAKFEEAIALTKRIVHSQIRADAIRSVIYNLVGANLKTQATEMLDSLRMSSLENPDRYRIHVQLIDALLALDINADAKQVIRNLRKRLHALSEQYGGYQETLQVILGELVSILIHHNDIQQAYEIAKTIPENQADGWTYYPDECTRGINDLISVLIGSRQYWKAFDLLDFIVQHPPDVLQLLLDNAVQIERLQKGAFLEALRFTLGILGWSHPAWLTFNEALH